MYTCNKQYDEVLITVAQLDELNTTYTMSWKYTMKIKTDDTASILFGKQSYIQKYSLCTQWYIYIVFDDVKCMQYKSN